MTHDHQQMLLPLIPLHPVEKPNYPNFWWALGDANKGRIEGESSWLWKWFSAPHPTQRPLLVRAASSPRGWTTVLEAAIRDWALMASLKNCLPWVSSCLWPELLPQLGPAHLHCQERSEFIAIQPCPQVPEMIENKKEAKVEQVALSNSQKNLFRRL